MGRQHFLRGGSQQYPFEDGYGKDRGQIADCWDGEGEGVFGKGQRDIWDQEKWFCRILLMANKEISEPFHIGLLEVFLTQSLLDFAPDC
jgi:hypothetical protein